MLIEFSVENFRSIKEKVTLSMVASKSNTMEENLISTGKDFNLLKSAAIYGPNASGKTNLIRALYLLSRFIIHSHKAQKGDKLPFTSFKLDKEYANKPSYFELVFLLNKIKYVYRLSADNEKVYHESLFYYPKGWPAKIFDRTEDNFTFIKNKKIQNDISEKTRSNASYISVATEWNYLEISKVFDWFKRFKMISPKTRGIEEYTIELISKNEDARKFVRELLKKADVGIEDFSAVIKEVAIEDAPKEVQKFVKLTMQQNEESENLKLKTTEIRSLHKTNEEEIWFDFEEESDGTTRLFDLSGPWFDIINKDIILLIDEIALNLHPHLIELLIKKFHENSRNESQLIFTTHHTYLLSAHLFRKDQIWFTEKKSNMSTELYSLYDIKDIRDRNIEKGYLLGRYGAIPYLDWR